MALEDDKLIMQELLALRRDLATVLANQQAAALREETMIAALEALRIDLDALRADLARTVKQSNRGRGDGRAEGG